MCARVRVIITGKLLWCWFFGNKISESEQDLGNFRKYLSLKISRYTVFFIFGQVSVFFFSVLAHFINKEQVYGKPGMPEQPRSTGTALFL